MEWFRLGAEKGHAVAQHDYGWMLVKGDGVTQDRAAGVHWLRAAARQGSEVAKDKLRGLGESLEEVRSASPGWRDLLKRLLG